MKVIQENIDRSWIQTYTGKKFFPLNPSHQDIDIIDIAHSLSLTCRFTGHCCRFYSVAEHTLRGLDIMEMFTYNEEDLLAFLLHDAGEAYLVDLAKPVKMCMPIFTEAEDKIMIEVNKAFNLNTSKQTESLVKSVDQFMLSIEARDLMGPLLPGWEEWEEKMKANPMFSKLYEETKINSIPIGWSSNTETVKDKFIKKFNLLSSNRKVSCRKRRTVEPNK